MIQLVINLLGSLAGELLQHALTELSLNKLHILTHWEYQRSLHSFEKEANKFTGYQQELFTVGYE